MRKDVLPPHHINSVIYKYTSSCGSDYIGRTSNQLDLCIKQHLPARILNLELKRGQLVNTLGSSIADHMINSRECMADFNVDSIFWVGHIRYIILKCWRPFMFDPFSLPSVNRGTVCWGWMWSVSNHLLISPTTRQFFFNLLFFLFNSFFFFFLLFFFSPLLHFFSITFSLLIFLALTAWEEPDETGCFSPF